jgi:hypothetical protein
MLTLFTLLGTILHNSAQSRLHNGGDTASFLEVNGLAYTDASSNYDSVSGPEQVTPLDLAVTCSHLSLRLYT